MTPLLAHGQCAGPLLRGSRNLHHRYRVRQGTRRAGEAAAYVDGAYGLNGLYVGVPVIIGAAGVERIVEIDLNTEERAMLDNSVAAVKALNDVVAGLT